MAGVDSSPVDTRVPDITPRETPPIVDADGAVKWPTASLAGSESGVLDAENASHVDAALAQLCTFIETGSSSGKDQWPAVSYTLLRQACEDYAAGSRSLGLAVQIAPILSPVFSAEFESTLEEWAANGGRLKAALGPIPQPDATVHWAAEESSHYLDLQAGGLFAHLCASLIGARVRQGEIFLPLIRDGLEQLHEAVSEQLKAETKRRGNESSREREWWVGSAASSKQVHSRRAIRIAHLASWDNFRAMAQADQEWLPYFMSALEPLPRDSLLASWMPPGGQGEVQLRVGWAWEALSKDQAWLQAHHIALLGEMVGQLDPQARPEVQMVHPHLAAKMALPQADPVGPATEQWGAAEVLFLPINVINAACEVQPHPPSDGWHWVAVVVHIGGPTEPLHVIVVKDKYVQLEGLRRLGFRCAQSVAATCPGRCKLLPSGKVHFLIRFTLPGVDMPPAKHNFCGDRVVDLFEVVKLRSAAPLRGWCDAIPTRAARVLDVISEMKEEPLPMGALPFMLEEGKYVTDEWMDACVLAAANGVHQDAAHADSWQWNVEYWQQHGEEPLPLQEPPAGQWTHVPHIYSLDLYCQTRLPHWKFIWPFYSERGNAEIPNQYMAMIGANIFMRALFLIFDFKPLKGGKSCRSSFTKFGRVRGADFGVSGESRDDLQCVWKHVVCGAEVPGVFQMVQNWAREHHPILLEKAGAASTDVRADLELFLGDLQPRLMAHFLVLNLRDCRATATRRDGTERSGGILTDLTIGVDLFDQEAVGQLWLERVEAEAGRRVESGVLGGPVHITNFLKLQQEGPAPEKKKRRKNEGVVRRSTGPGPGGVVGGGQGQVADSGLDP